MVFGNVTTLYLPTAANAGASQWGTDVRKLLDAADAASDATTITSHGTSGTTVRTFDPYTISTADLDQTLYGWAVTPSDMGSVAGARRFYPAGNHVATMRMKNSTATAATATFTIFAYRVSNAAGGRARSLLGTASNTGVAVPALAAEFTASVTLALGGVIFEPDETIQYSFEFTAPSVAVTGRTITMFTGTQTAVAARVDTPKLGVLSDTTGVAAGSSSADGLTSTVLPTTGVAAGSSSALGLMSAVASMTGQATGTSSALGLTSAVSGTTGQAAGSSSASGLVGAVIGTTGTATVGADCPSDWTPNDGLKAISGVVLFHEPPNEGDPVVGATVTLIRDSDGLLITTTVTDAVGAYSFPRDTNDPNTYHVEVRYTDAGGNQQGLSEGGCVPV